MGTYSKIYMHVVFGVKFRRHLIQRTWSSELYAYMGGIIKNKGQIPLIINGYRDHVHLLVTMNPSMSVSELVRDVKSNSTNFINQHKFTTERFCWQKGFGAFSYAPTQLSAVHRYIENQERHHAKRDFQSEYSRILDSFGVKYDPKYLFD